MAVLLGTPTLLLNTSKIRELAFALPVHTLGEDTTKKDMQGGHETQYITPTCMYQRKSKRLGCGWKEREG